MDLSKISYFIKAAELENFTKAAAACHIAQTTMSKYVASLEKELGVPLFQREHKEARLTAEGKKFYQGMLSIAKEYETLKQSLLPETDIHIGMALQEYIEIPLLKEFQKGYPKIPIYFSFKNEEELQEDLYHHRLDGLISPDAIPQNTYMQSIRLFPFSQSFVCSRSLWNAYGSIEAILSAKPLITKTESQVYHAQCQKRFFTLFSKTFSEVLTCRTLAEQMLRISLSQGFAILPLFPSHSYEDLWVMPLPSLFDESILLSYDTSHVSPVFSKLLQFIHEKKC